jgi:hypothetical protein
MIVRFRARLGSGQAGKLMDCFDCLSFWVAAPVTLLICRKRSDRLLACLALSGAACLLERALQEPVIIQPISQASEGGTDIGMLRSETRGAHERAGSAGDTGLILTSRQLFSTHPDRPVTWKFWSFRDLARCDAKSHSVTRKFTP